MSSSRQGFYSRLRVSPGWFKWVFSVWPPFLGMRISVTHISPDWREVDVRMKLGLRNRNYVGSHFGGGLFTMTDPFFMIMLMNLLGKGYLVWDKAATMQFIAPGRSTVYARFRISDEQIADIREKTAGGDKYEPIFSLDVVDEAGKVIAHLDKTVYIRRKAEKAASTG
jgi:acyl-coenzyme A thioesterase PaaI-like protein